MAEPEPSEPSDLHGIEERGRGNQTPLWVYGPVGEGAELQQARLSLPIRTQMRASHRWRPSRCAFVRGEVCRDDLRPVSAQLEEGLAIRGTEYRRGLSDHAVNPLAIRTEGGSRHSLMARQSGVRHGHLGPGSAL